MKTLKQPYGQHYPQNPSFSERACSHEPRTRWQWEHTVNEHGEPFMLIELEQFLSYLPEATRLEVLSEIDLAIKLAESGQLNFSDGSYSSYRLVSSDPTYNASHPVGPVKRIVSTKAVFEIVFEGRDYERKGSDHYRFVRLFFTEPPLDMCSEGCGLLSLMFSTKPLGGTDLQNSDARVAQDRYDRWFVA
ncbi:hypothetical protein [Trueperella sp. LYQ143]|uniref:hypothetical protein n=1 Tax=Trueperella sp. LYQ143 TaxID=3391059 RepID=UPI0039835A86